MKPKTYARSARLSGTSVLSPLDGGEYVEPDELLRRPREAKAALRLLERFLELADDTELTPTQAMGLVDAVESAAKVDIHDEDFPPIPCLPVGIDPEDFKRWTVGIVRGVWKVIASVAGLSVQTLYEMAITQARIDLLIARSDRKQVMKQVDHGRRLRLLPGTEELAKISRYETHLERCFYRALHELQRIQAMRVGIALPPLAVDVNLSGRGLD